MPVYLHLGDDIIISGDKIIAIINLEEPVPEGLRTMLAGAALDRTLYTISKTDKKKALVLCDDCHYLSPISSNTLFKRLIRFR